MTGDAGPDGYPGAPGFPGNLRIAKEKDFF